MTVEPRGSIAPGFRALRHGKLILLLAGTTVVLGLLCAMPLASVFQADFAGTLVGDHFLRHSPLAATDFVDFFERKTDAIRGTRRTASAAGVLGVLLQAFFAGGIVVVLGRGRFSFGQFFEPARRNLWHNVKCLVLFLSALAVVVGGWIAGALAGREKLFENAPPESGGRRLAWWATLLVGLLLYALLSLVYDLARAARRYAPAIGAWRAVRFAWRALGGAWLRALALFGFWFVAGALVVGAGVGVVWALPAVSRPAIALLVVLQLAVLALRSAVRVGAWGSYLAFLDPRAMEALASLQARPPVALPAPAPVPAAEPGLTFSRPTP
jgi:hypothetical protein